MKIAFLVELDVLIPDDGSIRQTIQEAIESEIEEYGEDDLHPLFKVRCLNVRYFGTER